MHSQFLWQTSGCWWFDAFFQSDIFFYKKLVYEKLALRSLNFEYFLFFSIKRVSSIKISILFILRSREVTRFLIKKQSVCVFSRSSRFSESMTLQDLLHNILVTLQFVDYYISMQCYYISMQLIGWSFCYISSRALLHFYAAFLLHFYASFITFLCRYYISMQAYYISMQV